MQPNNSNEPDSTDALKWKPSIHMPRWASRVKLEITDVRVEQIQEISQEDAFKEGVKPDLTKRPNVFIPNFKAVWNKVYGNGSWASNPWVWVIEFIVMG